MDFITASHTFLLVGNTEESGWTSVLVRALSPLGSVHIVSEEVAYSTDRFGSPDVIIIDAAETTAVTPLLSHLGQWHPRAQLIVATASPTWRRAREAFRAGAADYIRKSMDETKLRSNIEAVLKPSLNRPEMESPTWER